MPEDTGIISGSGFAGAFAGVPDGGGAATRWGDASAPPAKVTVGDTFAWVLPRHGNQHDIPAHAVNYRANIARLGDLGVRRIIGLNTVGVITSICRPGELLVPRQLIDYTWGRAGSYFDGGPGGLRHIEFDEPFAPTLRTALLASARRAGVPCADGGVCAVMQGPRLETAAEIDRLERDGADIVGMTALPEAALAAELGIEYACLALAVNPAAGRGGGPIHAEVAAHSANARAAALAVVQALFDDAGTRTMVSGGGAGHG